MIVPSIDLRRGHAVQLVGGETEVIDAGDPRPIADQFGRAGEIAVIDLDAALGTGDNTSVIEDLISRAPCRVGGGIRSVDSAVRWLDAGARKVILGTAATPEILRELPRDRTIAALDARDGEVVTEGWTRATGTTIEDRLEELSGLVGGFLITFVEIEGRMTGLPLDRVQRLIELAHPARVTIAGGVQSTTDIRAVDALGGDTQVGMALYSGAFDLADGFCAPLKSDRADGLWPTVVCDEAGRCLGQVYSNLESVRAALNTGEGVYFSRSRNSLWRKGATSGNVQKLIGIAPDCDRDALRFTVSQQGDGFCHTGMATCFGGLEGLAQLDAIVHQRLTDATPGSYTARLRDDPSLLASKLIEEARELIEARTPGDAAHEAADLIYFALVAAQARGATLASIEAELDRRRLKVSRRPGDAKPDQPVATTASHAATNSNASTPGSHS